MTRPLVSPVIIKLYPVAASFLLLIASFWLGEWLWNTFKNSSYSLAAYMSAFVISLTCFGVFIAQAASFALQTRGGEG